MAPDPIAACSVCAKPFARQAAIDAAVADYAQALSSALGWPGGISDPVLDWPTLLRYVAEARAVPEGWAIKRQPDSSIVVRSPDGAVCSVGPHELEPRIVQTDVLYKLCNALLAATPSPAEQPKPAVLTAEDALSLIGVAHWPGMEKGLSASLLPMARKIAEAAGDRGLARLCDELLAALSGEQP